MWSKGGAWPTKEPVKLTMENRGYHVLRRWVRSWRKADARAKFAEVLNRVEEGRIDGLKPHAVRDARRRIPSARTMLRCPDLKLSGVRGLSEWISEDLTLRMIERLSLDGYPVES